MRESAFTVHHSLCVAAFPLPVVGVPVFLFPVAGVLGARPQDLCPQCAHRTLSLLSVYHRLSRLRSTRWTGRITDDDPNFVLSCVHREPEARPASQDPGRELRAAQSEAADETQVG